MRVSVLALAPVLVAWPACPGDKDTADTGLPDGCEAVAATCPEDGGRAYWSTCEGGGWDEVNQCIGATCVPADHGEELMHGADGSTWSDVWATCDEGYGHLEGVICCL